VLVLKAADRARIEAHEKFYRDREAIQVKP
jgi:hypothetical protein